MRRLKRTVALMLALVMALAILPVSAFAGDEPAPDDAAEPVALETETETADTAEEVSFPDSAAEEEASDGEVPDPEPVPDGEKPYEALSEDLVEPQNLGDSDWYATIEDDALVLKNSADAGEKIELKIKCA